MTPEDEPKRTRAQVRKERKECATFWKFRRREILRISRKKAHNQKRKQERQNRKAGRKGKK